MTLHPSFPQSLTRRDLIALLALFALVLAFFWKLAFTNLIIARGDIFYYFYPYRDFAAQAVREGRVALWNPYLFMGAPFMANSQAGFFYPFNLLMSWLETTRAINWTIVLHSFIAASGVYVFARSILRLSIAGAFLVELISETVWGQFLTIHMLILGIIVVGVVIFIPRGLLDLFRKKISLSALIKNIKNQSV